LIDLGNQIKVRFYSNYKIDLNAEYPCPCRRKGRLLPIILTDAMGCDRCQQIFVVTETGKEIEQLSSVYPYKRRWRWTGKRWVSKGMWGMETYLPLIIWPLLVMLVISIPLVIKLTGGIGLFFGIIISLILFLLSLSFWLIYRR
jgi:hypothetical protein